MRVFTFTMWAVMMFCMMPSRRPLAALFPAAQFQTFRARCLSAVLMFCSDTSRLVRVIAFAARAHGRCIRRRCSPAEGFSLSIPGVSSWPVRIN